MVCLCCTGECTAPETAAPCPVPLPALSGPVASPLYRVRPAQSPVYRMISLLTRQRFPLSRGDGPAPRLLLQNTPSIRRKVKLFFSDFCTFSALSVLPPGGRFSGLGLQPSAFPVSGCTASPPLHRLFHAPGQPGGSRQNCPTHTGETAQLPRKRPGQFTAVPCCRSPKNRSPSPPGIGWEGGPFQPAADSSRGLQRSGPV